MSMSGLSKKQIQYVVKIYAISAIVLDSIADRMESATKEVVEMLRLSASVYGSFGEMMAMGPLEEASSL